MIDIKPVSFPNYGFLQVKLDGAEREYLWNIIKKHKDSAKHKLAGHIDNSYDLADTNNWFFNNVLVPLCHIYGNTYSNLGNTIPTNNKHPLYLEAFWVNFQKQNEFNPLHDHSGIYSFVIWMKIPTDFTEQNSNVLASTTRAKKISVFDLHYINTLGKIDAMQFNLDKSYEGTLLFFPSKFDHCVYPYYNCDDIRVSISGNISLNTNIII